MQLITRTFRAQALAFPDRVDQLLSTISTTEEAKGALDLGAAMQELAKRRNESFDVQAALSLGMLKMYAFVGELCPARTGSELGRGKKVSDASDTFTADQRHTYRKIAKHKERLVAYCEACAESEELPSQAGFLKFCTSRRDKQSKTRADKTANLREQYDLNIRSGDFREVLADIGNINAIVTDPPYGKHGLELWSDLGLFASNHLAPSGMLIAYSGQMYLPQVYAALSEHLEYWWTLGLFHSGSGHMSPLGNPVRKVIIKWKPILIFYRPGEDCLDRVFKDVVPSEKPDKTAHNWAQAVSEGEWLIESFTDVGDLVCDPFAGSGTTGLAAQNTGREFVGAEILNG